MAGLFEVIANKNEQQTQLQSIVSHLIKLLNTRRGSLNHMPDYGLPNVINIYQALPDSIPTLLNAMRETIEKYEPRLCNVAIRQSPHLDKECVVQLELSAMLNNGREILLDTYFLGNASVSSCEPMILDTELNDYA